MTLGSARSIQTAAAAAAGNRMIVDSAFSLPDNPPDGEHWYIEQVSLTAVDATGTMPQPRWWVSGLFICPPGTPVATPNNSGVLNTNVDNLSLIQPLPTDAVGFWYSISGAAFARVACIQKFVLPSKSFLRAVLSCAGAQPAAGTVLNLNWSYFRRANSACPVDLLSC